MLSILRKRALISYAVTEKLISVFVFAHWISRLSNDAAQMIRILSLFVVIGTDLSTQDVQSSGNRYYFPIFTHTHRSSSPVGREQSFVCSQSYQYLRYIYNVGMSVISMGGGLIVAGGAEMTWGISYQI